MLMLVNSLIPLIQQTQLASPDILEGRAADPGPQDRLVPSYILHSPIKITSNADFTAQSFPGSGTAEDPYVIEGYNITTTETCIGIRDTDACFVIRDCLLKGEMLGGVHLRNVNHGEIRNNTILGGAYFGVALQSSSDNTVVNNTISGIYVHGDGVYIFSSSDNTVVNNTISEYNYGVSIVSALNNTLSSNIFVNNGIYISGNAVEYWRQNITTDNFVNGKPLGYFWNWTSGTIDGTQYGQVLLANCTGVIVEDGVFSNASMGIQLGYSSYCSLMNNIISGNHNGVHIHFSSNSTLVNNTISGNESHGVVFGSSSDNTLVNNTISGNHGEGVYIPSSSDNTLVNNTISGNYYNGVFLPDPGTSNNTLVNNTISGNSWSGVYIFGSSDNTIVNNTISGNSKLGVSISSSSNNTVVNNTISGNNNTGVSIWTFSSDNLIYLNVIADNDNGNANDYGTGNHWNITGRGNYWSDHTGTGVYNVPGSAGSIDYYPFIYPPETTTPTIDQPADMDYEEGTTGNTITWTPSDAHPSHYVVYRNGTEVALASWNGNSITVEVDGLNVGIYDYRIVVYDTSGNSNSDTVIVTVISTTTTPTTTTTTTTTTTETTLPDNTMLIVFGGVGVAIVAAVIVVMRFRRK